jgi:hypothetical protein
MPHVLSADEISTLLGHFVESAARVKRCGSGRKRGEGESRAGRVPKLFSVSRSRESRAAANAASGGRVQRIDRRSIGRGITPRDALSDQY